MQKEKPDYAFLELIRTEQHPDRMPDNVLFRLKVVFGSVNGRDLTADVFTPKEIPSSPRPAIVSAIERVDLNAED